MIKMIETNNVVRLTNHNPNDHFDAITRHGIVINIEANVATVVWSDRCTTKHSIHRLKKVA